MPVFWTRLTATVGLVVGASWSRRRPARQPVARRPARAAARRPRRARIAPVALRSDQRCRPGGRQAPRTRAGVGSVRRMRGTVRASQAAGRDLRGRRPARPDAAGRLGPRRARAAHRARSSAAPCPGAWETVLLWIHRVPFSRDGVGHRPDLQPRHRLLPVRAAVPAPRPGPVQRRSSSARSAPDARRATSSARRAAGWSSRPRSASTWRSSAGCSCCRSPSATSSTSSSCRTAPGASRRASASPTRTPSSSPTTS